MMPMGRGSEVSMPTELKTDSELLARLSAAAKHRMTRDEILQQKISFILGNMSGDSTVTRRQIEEVLAKAEGVAA